MNDGYGIRKSREINGTVWKLQNWGSKVHITPTVPKVLGTRDLKQCKPQSDDTDFLSWLIAMAF